MGLTFLQPAFFAALAAVAIPIVIHLMERRREVTVRLATVRFILEAHRRTSRRLKIRRWLLLILRILMIVLLTMALARPVILRREALLNTARPTSTVIILDNSPSMDYGQGPDSRWGEARRLAAEFADRLVGAGEAGLLAGDGSGISRGFLRDRRELAVTLEKLALSHRPGDFSSALNSAYRLLKAAAYPDRQIVLVTDMTRPEWGRFDPKKLVQPDLGVPVRLVDISGGSRGWNRSIRLVEVFSRPGEDGVGRVRVSLDSYGEVAEQATSIQLELDGRLLARRVVDPGGLGEQSFEFNLPPMESGVHRLLATLDGDPLPFDNRFFTAFDYGGRIGVLTVDGSPQASLINSETYFLRAALVPDRLSEEAAVSHTVVLPAQLTPESLAGYNIIILANVRSLEPATAQALAAWAGRGGGLIIFLGDNYQPGVYQSSLDAGGADLLPLFLGDVVQADGEGIRYADYTAYPLQIFERPGSGDFSRVRFGRYVSPGPGGLKPGARSLLAFDDKGERPFLVERPLGQGRVMLFTSSADLDWNNLATQTVYLPLLQRSLEYMASRRGLSARPVFTPGDLLALDLEPGQAGERVPVTTPGGNRLEAGVERSGSSVRAVAAASEGAGFYDFYPGEKEVPVPVNLDRSESDVRRVAEETIAAAAGLLPLQTVKLDEKDLAEERLRGSYDPTPWIFALLLACLAIEGAISAGLRRRQAPEPRVVA